MVSLTGGGTWRKPPIRPKSLVEEPGENLRSGRGHWWRNPEKTSDPPEVTDPKMSTLYFLQTKKTPLYIWASLSIVIVKCCVTIVITIVYLQVLI